MTTCLQCNGKKVTIGVEGIVDLYFNSETPTLPNLGSIPCSQCNGTGIMTSFGV